MMSAVSLSERKSLYRERVEVQETYRDYIIDIVGVWGPLLAPAVPAALTMVSIAMHYPTLLHIHWLAAVAIGLIVAVVIEVLGVVSVETFLDMKSYNQVIGEGEERAPAGWAGAIMTLYIGIVLSLVVLLKMIPALALISLVPLTLLAGVTSWIVVMRKQHRFRIYRKEVALVEEKRQTDLVAIAEELRAKLETLAAENQRLRGQLADQRTTAVNQSSGFGVVALPAANDARVQNVEKRRAAIATLLVGGAALTTAEIQEGLEAMGFTTGIGEKTVREDLKGLGAERNGHRWAILLGDPEA